jgi:hypothetical protein
MGTGASIAVKQVDRHRETGTRKQAPVDRHGETGSAAVGKKGSNTPGRIAGEHADPKHPRVCTFTSDGLPASERALTVDVRPMWALVHTET